MHTYSKVICFFFLILMIIIPLSSYADTSTFVWSSQDLLAEVSRNLDNIDLKLESGSSILIEQNSGNILYEQNSHEQLHPASVTKVMSILLIMEALDSGRISLDDKVPCSENAASMGGSQIWLDVREELSVDDMLKAICVVSANDCCVAMAEYLAGSEEAFVKNMNERAKELGMKDTVFKNCHGIDTDGHVTSAYDIALMSRELLKNHHSITNYTTIWMDSLRDGKSELVNTNKLIRNYKGATGLKTGSTGLALYNLSASATRDGLSLIAVIMKAPSTQIRFSEAQKLLDFGFSNFEYASFANKSSVLKEIVVEKGVENSINAIFEDNSGCVMQKGMAQNIEQIVALPDSVSAPIEAGDKIGEVQYLLNGEIIGTTNLVSDTSVKKMNLVNMSEKIFSSWFRMLR